MWKENCKLLMLPTSDTSAPLCKDIKYLDVQMSEDFESMEYPRHQHLYVVSDEEITENDLFIDLFGSTIKKGFNGIEMAKGLISTSKKIIATTDKSLGLPLIPHSLVLGFQIRYNTPSPIESILVEYEPGGVTRCHKRAGGHDDVINKDTIVVNGDNTINYKVLTEKTYNRQEVIDLLKKFKHDNCYSICFDDNQFENWAAKNLKK